MTSNLDVRYKDPLITSRESEFDRAAVISLMNNLPETPETSQALSEPASSSRPAPAWRKWRRWLALMICLFAGASLRLAPADEPQDGDGAKAQAEAVAALRTEKWAEARQAAGAAWKQGRQTPEVLALRTRAESAVAFPPSLSGGVHWPVDFDRAKVEPESLGERLRTAAQAVALFNQWRTDAAPKGSSKELVELGTTVLLSGSRLLRYASEDEGRLEKHQLALTEMRRVMRETAAAVQAVKSADEADEKGHFYQLTSTYLPYWYEKPSEAVTAWGELLARRFTGTNRMNLYATVRGQLLERQAGGQEYCKLPWLVGWHGESADDVRQLWQGFTDSLLASKDEIKVLDGRLLEAAEVVGNERYHGSPALTRLFDQVWTSRAALLQQGLAYEYLWTVVTGGLAVFDPTHTALEKRWLIYYLDNTKRADFQIMGAIWKVDGLTPAEAADLFQHWVAHKKRLGLKPEYSGTYETRLFEKFPELGPPPAADAIVVKRFWFPPELGEIALMRVSKPVWADGHLWLTLWYDKAKVGAPGVDEFYRILELEVPSLKVVDRIEAGPGIPALLMVRPEAIYSQDNGFEQPTKMQRYDRMTKAWSVLPLPSKSFLSAYVDEERLVAGYEDYEGAGECGIVQWTAATGEVTMLSNNRRRPAQNQFDDRARYDIRHVFAAPDGSPTVLIDKVFGNPHAYTYDAATKRWNDFLPTKFRVDAVPLDGGTLFLSPECGLGMIGAKGQAIEPWFASRFPAPAEPFQPSAPAELKHLAVDIFPYLPLTMAAGKLCSLRMKQAAGGAGEVLVLDVFDHEKLVLERPIRFEASKEADQLRAHHVSTDATKPPVEASSTDMVGTDAGLFFKSTDSPGYWFLPIGELGLERPVPGAK